MKKNYLTSRIEDVKESGKEFQLVLSGGKSFFVAKDKLSLVPQKGQEITLSFLLNTLVGIELDGTSVYGLDEEGLLQELRKATRLLETEIYRQKVKAMTAEVDQRYAKLTPIFRHRLALFKLAFPKKSMEHWFSEVKAFELAEALYKAYANGQVKELSTQNIHGLSETNEIKGYALNLAIQMARDLQVQPKLETMAVEKRMLLFSCSTLRLADLDGDVCGIKDIVSYMETIAGEAKAV